MASRVPHLWRAGMVAVSDAAEAGGAVRADNAAPGTQDRGGGERARKPNPAAA